MQNLHKFAPTRIACLTVALLASNFDSIFAQDERKAFKEGDKIIGVGFAGASSNNLIAPAITFDYGLKGTSGLLSIGGFMSYTMKDVAPVIPFGIGGVSSFGGSDFIQYSSKSSDSTYTTITDKSSKSKVFTAGIRLAIHYSTRKFDFYAGAMAGNRITTNEYGPRKREFYKGTFQSINSKLLDSDYQNSFSQTSSEWFVSPYAGAKYYLTNKVSLNLEVGQYSGHVGLGFKF